MAKLSWLGEASSDYGMFRVRSPRLFSAVKTVAELPNPTPSAEIQLGDPEAEGRSLTFAAVDLSASARSRRISFGLPPAALDAMRPILEGARKSWTPLCVDRDDGAVYYGFVKLQYERARIHKSQDAYFDFTFTLEPEKEKPTMAQRIENIAIIANDNVTTLKASFSWANKGDTKTYDFKVMRDFAKDLKPGDAVVVDSANGLSVAKVLSVDEFADVTPDSIIDYKWAFAKVDVAVLDELNRQEQAVIDRLKTAQRESVKTQALKAMGLEGDALANILAAPIKQPRAADTSAGFTSDIGSGMSGGPERVGGGIIGEDHD